MTRPTTDEQGNSKECSMCKTPMVFMGQEGLQKFWDCPEGCGPECEELVRSTHCWVTGCDTVIQRLNENEDNPYGHKCPACGTSLRTHPDYGVGMRKDSAVTTKWFKPENLEGMKQLVGQQPHMIHADSNPHNIRAYPTHTHGLVTVNLPEIIMHAACFGPQGNAQFINAVVGSLMLNPDYYQSFMETSYAEHKVGIYAPKDDIVLCLRKIDPDFLGVKTAYNEPATQFGYAQLYVKGDTLALTDEYYLNVDMNSGCNSGCMYGK